MLSKLGRPWALDLTPPKDVVEGSWSRRKKEFKVGPDTVVEQDKQENSMKEKSTPPSSESGQEGERGTELMSK